MICPSRQNARSQLCKLWWGLILIWLDHRHRALNLSSKTFFQARLGRKKNLGQQFTFVSLRKSFVCLASNLGFRLQKRETVIKNEPKIQRFFSPFLSNRFFHFMRKEFKYLNSVGSQWPRLGNVWDNAFKKILLNWSSWHSLLLLKLLLLLPGPNQGRANQMILCQGKTGAVVVPRGCGSGASLAREGA